MTLNELKYQRRDVKVKLAKISTDIVNVETSNILHLILSCITVGTWLVVWLVCALISVKQRKSLQKKSVKLSTELGLIEDLLEDDIGVR
jgi:Gpi18-like mannosyltransferase